VLSGWLCIAPINISSSLFQNNSASNHGGAIYTSSCNVTLVDSNMTGNTALAGGAIYSSVSYALDPWSEPRSYRGPGFVAAELVDCVCSGNSASSGNGGCLVADGVLLSMQGGSYSRNKAAEGKAVSYLCLSLSCSPYHHKRSHMDTPPSFFWVAHRYG
jgi:predicted outer membrane repeat protein